MSSEVKDKIFDILDGTKPWYSLLARVDFLTLPMWTILVVGIYHSLDGLLGTNKEKEVINVSIILASVILIFVYKRLDELRTWLFPVGYFAFGQGEHRYEIREKVHWGIIITFVVSLAASMVRLIW